MKSLAQYVTFDNVKLCQYIQEALSKNLKKESDRLWKRGGGRNPLQLWKHLVSTKPQEIYDRLKSWNNFNNDQYKYNGKEYKGDFDKFINEWGVTKGYLSGLKLFKDRHFFVKKFNFDLTDQDKIKKYLLSKEIIDNLDLDLRTTEIYTLEDSLDEFENYPEVSQVEIVKNTWCVHFMFDGIENHSYFKFDNIKNKSEFIDIIKNGFKYGSPYPKEDFTEDDLFSLYKSVNNKKVKNGINFGFLLKDAKQNFVTVNTGYNTKYGNLGIVFKIKNGLVVYHTEDKEFQTLFVAKDASDFIPIYTDFTKNKYQILDKIR